MRIGVIADVHANLLALDAVLDAGDALGVERWICLGDLVGYGPQSRECLDRCTERDIECILGNHEARLLGLPTARFNTMVEKAIELAARQIGVEGRNQLRSFAATIDVDGEALFCHGSPADRDVYLFALSQLQAVIVEHTHPLIFCGHTHQQYAFDGVQLWTGPGELDLGPVRRLLVNPGSVGQPRDGDPRAAFALWDRSQKRLYMRRVAYDVPEQVRRALDAGLPEHLALRLEAGR